METRLATLLPPRSPVPSSESRTMEKSSGTEPSRGPTLNPPLPTRTDATVSLTTPRDKGSTPSSRSRLPPSDTLEPLPWAPTSSISCSPSLTPPEISRPPSLSPTNTPPTTCSQLPRDSSPSARSSTSPVGPMDITPRFRSLLRMLPPPTTIPLSTSTTSASRPTNRTPILASKRTTFSPESSDKTSLPDTTRTPSSATTLPPLRPATMPSAESSRPIGSAPTPPDTLVVSISSTP